MKKVIDIPCEVGENCIILQFNGNQHDGYDWELKVVQFEYGLLDRKDIYLFSLIEYTEAANKLEKLRYV